LALGYFNYLAVALFHVDLFLFYASIMVRKAPVKEIAEWE